MDQELLALAGRLIAVPGYTELPEKETRVAETLCAALQEMGLPAQLRDYDGRYNVACTVQSGRPGPHVVLCTHLDTVPPYEMEEPFHARVKDGRLYGRGAVDVRGTLAAMSVALRRIAQQKHTFLGAVSLLAVSDEESGSFGMRQEVAHGFVGDVTIVGEPTELKLGIAHKGVCWHAVEFFGKSAHGSVPENGHSSILDAVDFIQLIETQLQPKLRRCAHPLLSHATVNIGKITGGTRPTIVPEHCELQIDRRLVPGESAESTRAEFHALLQMLQSQKLGFNAEQKILLGGADKPFPPLDSSGETELIAHLRRAGIPVLGKELECVGLPFWTDAALAAYGTGKPAFVCGPGSIVQAHANDEYVELRQLEQAAELYYRMALAVCSAEGGK